MLTIFYLYLFDRFGISNEPSCGASKKGQIVGIPIWVVHHDEDVYPEPDKFKPERFNEANKSKMESTSFLILLTIFMNLILIPCNLSTMFSIKMEKMLISKK